MKTFLLVCLLPMFIFCETKTEKPQIQEIEKQVDNSKHNIYSWKESYSIENKLINRIDVPTDFERIEVEKDSFSDWLRNLPLKDGNPEVMLYDGTKKGNQNAQYAVVDIDVGSRDLQQCADAVIRLRAEYLFSSQQKEEISFKFTSGDECAYDNWRKGIRPKISGNQVSFSKTAQEDNSYKNFKNYMKTIFMYCGTYSLEKELDKVNNVNDIKAGDVFIMGGFPGHAVTVMDVAKHKTNGEKVFLLSQSYMPAQDIHILKNPINKDLSPWFSVKFGENLITPEWTFTKEALKRF